MPGALRRCLPQCRPFPLRRISTVMVMVAASCVAPRPVTATTRPKPRSAEPRTAGSQATDEVQLRQRAEQAEKELASFKFRTAVIAVVAIMVSGACMWRFYARAASAATLRKVLQDMLKPT